MKEMRIDKFLSQMQIATRTESKKLIKAGRVRLDACPVTDAAMKIDPNVQRVYVDGKLILYREYEYLMLYKPAGCITATEDGRQKTVMDYLPKERPGNLSPVGRLDKDTEGLLLLTNDGELNHNLLSPAKHVKKTYFARIRGRVTEKEVKAFQEGIDIGEKRLTAPAELSVLHSDETSDIEVTVTEGKFHQIKRMFQAVGMEVLYLKRIRMGPLRLDEALKPGQWRELTAEEIKELKGSTNG